MRITRRNFSTIGLGLGLGLLLLASGPQGCGSADPLATLGPGSNIPVGALSQAEGLGKDGDLTVSMAGTIVNRYAVLAADAKPGDTSLTLSGMAGLGLDALMPLAVDDLLLIIQMQGADIDTTNSASYGSVIDLRSAGLYEFIGVTAVDLAAGKVSVYAGCGGLKNSYQATGRVQVIRVPQYSNLSIAAGASIAAPAWDGQRGGVVAVQVRDTVTIDGSIDVARRGFRGGKKNPITQRRPAGIGSYYRTMSALDGGNRGEGIAGYESEYLLTGQFGRGAAANGGGGGNRVAAGGGGGAGGGDIATWNGQGVMPLTVPGGAAAWLLDPGYQADKMQFAGGGRGGYTYSGAALDPTMVAPGDQSWGEDFRRERGGLGGRPVPNDPKIRLFLGGGGGSGDDYQNTSGAGGAGGGMVFIDARKITGSGQILADGAPGAPSTATSSGGGGGGGGGTVVVAATTTVDGITIQAGGGPGGAQQGATATASGPGGGGGGGFIAAPQGVTITQQVAGGAGGSTASADLTAFPRNGATDGAAGQLGAAVGPYGGAPYCSVADLGVTITATPAEAKEREPVRLDLAVTNIGPGTSGNVVVKLDLPEGVSIASTEAQGWTCQPTNLRLTCTLATLPAGAAPNIAVNIVPALGATELAFTARVSAPTTDLDMSNNTATLTVNNPAPLVARPAGGGFGCAATGEAPRPAPLGLALFGLLLGAVGISRRRVAKP
ncbi:MAG: DUF11 domain-containing protein [Polyangia bacterium]